MIDTKKSGMGLLAQAIPGMGEVLARSKAAKAGTAVSGLRDTLDTHINDMDIAHMHAFPAELKTQVLDRVVHMTPLATEVQTVGHHYEKALMQLQHEGYGLIDLQPAETQLTAVWYRKSRMPWSKRVDVVTLIWEQKFEGDSTTLMSWRI